MNVFLYPLFTKFRISNGDSIKLNNDPRINTQYFYIGFKKLIVKKIKDK